MSAKEVIKKALDVAVAVKEEAAESGREVRVALDVSNLGELVEPMGTLSFEDAYDEYAEIVRAGAENGADIIMIETMTDLYDTKAAVLAAKENTDLPVIVSMTFEVDGRTFTGVSIEAVSYTHLDVYKRQHIHISIILAATDILWGNIMCRHTVPT